MNYIEEKELELFLIEASCELDTRINAIKIDSGFIMEGKTIKNVGSSIKKFIDDMIKKLKEIIASIKKRIADKVLEMKFQKECNELKKIYAKSKANLTGKKITLFDYVRYKKRIGEYIKETIKMMDKATKLDPEKENIIEFVNDNTNKLNLKYVDIISGEDAYEIQYDIGTAIRISDKYVDMVEKLTENIQASIDKELQKLSNMDIDIDVSFESTPNKLNKLKGEFVSDMSKVIKTVSSSLLKIGTKAANILGKAAYKMIQFVHQLSGSLLNKIDKKKNGNVNGDNKDTIDTNDAIDNTVGTET